MTASFIVYHPSMQADFAVELGADDETLDFPWGVPGGLRYYDLKHHPELLQNIEEASREPSLAEFLMAMNSSRSSVETVKCDVWSSDEINPEEEIYGAACKFGSYVDLIFAAPSSRVSFPRHEQFSREIVQLLHRAPELPAAAEFLIRRCCLHGDGHTQEGFYFTFYLFGYGDDDSLARQRWAIALKLAANAIGQLSPRLRPAQ